MFTTFLGIRIKYFIGVSLKSNEFLPYPFINSDMFNYSILQSLTIKFDENMIQLRYRTNECAEKVCFKRQLHSDQKNSQDAENVSKKCLDLVRKHHFLCFPLIRYQSF